MNILVVYMLKLLNDWNGRFYDSLQAKDAAAFRDEIVYWIVLVAILIFVLVYAQWFQQLLTIRWRTWLTNVYFRDWLSNLTYYRMELVGDGTDNPEQRIEQDCADFADQTLDISIDLLSQVMTLVTFIAILWGLSGGITLPIFGGIVIPGYMVWVALLYSVIGTWLTYKIGRPLVRINFDLQRYNADFRYRMTRIRDNAEPIALYHGESDEARGLTSAFARVYANWWLFMKYNKRLNWLTSFYGQVAHVFPIIVAAPRYFAGAVPLGNLTQTAGAFAQVQGALSWFVNSYTTVARWMAVVERLTSFGEAMERAKELEAADKIRVSPDGDRRAASARSRPAPPEWQAAARRGKLYGAAWRNGVGRRPVGKWQNHIVPRPCRIVALWQGRGKRARRLARAVPAAAAVFTDRHAARRAHLSRSSRRVRS